MAKYFSKLVLVSAILVLLGIKFAYAAIPVAPSITTQPVNVTVTAPAKATFTVAASGTPAPTYQWMESVDGVTFTNVATGTGATKASYTTAATSAADNGIQYECVITNASGSVTSNAATLMVNVVPSITAQPTGLTVTAPATATFTVAASGTPAPTYQWQQETPGANTYTAITGATSSSYTTQATALTDGGTLFECVISNTAGSVTSKAAALTVDIVPSIISQPVNATVTAPAKATFTVAASGTPAPTYQWMESVDGGAFTNVTTGTGATKASYTTAASSAADNGTQYECVVTNASGSVTSNAATLTVNVLPSITTQPTDLTVTAPATATFTVAASGLPAPTYQWQQEIHGSSTYTAIPGAVSASYTTPATTAADNKTKFECVISNAAGGVTSSAAKLTVDIIPSITVQPVDVTVTAPAKAKFTVTASGTPKPTYQWMESVNGGAYSNITGATSRSYTTAATTAVDNGTQYECVVSNAAGSVTSNAATLTVNSTSAAPTITTQPLSQTVTAPASVTFTAAASGTPAPTYQWEVSTNGGTSFTPISGATSASYTIISTTTAMSGNEYELVASNGVSPSATSNAATLTVNPTPVAPSITTQPLSQTVTAPETATFTIEASGTPAPTYQWMQEAPGAGVYTAITGATSASYTTPATTAANSGTQYECVIINTAGSVTSNAATLTVNVVPSITTQPASQTVTLPATATFSIVATGSPTPTYQWMQSVNGGEYANISGATSSSYTTPVTTAANNDTQYECVVSNASGSVTSNAATLTVNAVPSITTQPTSQTVTAQATATFTLTASGTPAPSYQWIQEAPGANTYSAIQGANSASYSVVATTANNGTQYECLVSNTAGSAISNAVTLTVNTAPSITTQPTSQTVTAPATATFTVAATGAPTPAYQWMQSVNGGAYTVITGAISASYTTAATTTADSGTQYECVVSNSTGSVTTTAAMLTVNPTPVLPSITTQPTSLTVTAPATATFTIAANGTPSPTYQWMQEAPGAGTYAAITGATSASYTTPATTITNSGTQYECVVSNTAGSVTSNPALLTVNPAAPAAPVITTQPVSVTVVAPAPATFTVVATGTPAPTYQWEQGISLGRLISFQPISGATSASYTTPATTAGVGGTFECVVTNASGSVTSTPASYTATAPVAPSITAQPTNQTVTAPAPATFTVAASGVPSPSYQWMQSINGGTYTNIIGATSATYTTPATTAANNGTLYECVASNASGSATSNPASLTVNVSLTPVVSITSPTNNSTLTAGSNLTITASAVETGGNINSVTFYNGTTPLGTSTTSPYSYTVTNITAGTYNLTAVATDANNVSTTSSSVTVTVNSIPVVNITGPANNNTFTAGSSITITASASETNGIINLVSFYNGTTLLGTSNASPYSFTTNNLTVGTYTLTAKAMDANNVSTTSSPVTITVTGQPVVNIASPVNNSTLTTGSISITAIATENYGSISNVTIYNGSTALATITSTSQAFTYLWTNVPAGTYNLTAIATDIMGTTASSSPTAVNINSANFTNAIDDNILSITDALNHTTSYQYDNLNRLLKTTFADGSTVASAYDLFGNQISVTDQRGNTLTKTYDAYERLSQTKDPLGDITQFNYDTNGDLLTLTDANGDPTSYTYDGNYRVLTQTNALNFTTAFTYDLVGNVSSRTDANGKATDYAYDALNRLTNTAYPDGSSVANVYDALGRKTSMTDSTGETGYTYDPLNRLLSKTSPGSNNTITYTYDGEGNRLTSVDQNNRTINNAYDALNRLSSVTDPNGTTSYGYDAVSNKLSVTSPNGVSESYIYDALNRVLTAVNQLGGSVISSFSNVYDIAGMITKKILQDGTWTVYSYDAINRILEETKQTSSSIVYDYVYTYDPVGNRLTWTKNTTLGGFWNVDSLNMPSQVLTNMTTAGYGNTANPAQTATLARNYTYDAANRLSNWNYAVNIYTASFPVQTDTYTYDNNGNRLTKQAVLTGEASTPQQTTYSYDFENRLNQLNYINIPNITGTQTDNLIYNGEGLRTQAVLNSVAVNYLYDGSNILVERNASGDTTKTYTRGLDFSGGIGSLIAQEIPGSSPVVQYYDYNDLGSTADLTSSAGTAASDYSYDAFGNLLTPQAGSDTNRYLFSTKEFDSRSGLDYFGRYYDPEIGRWLTPDPLGMVNGPNMYLYCLNNPVNLLDPYGLEIERQIYGANFNPDNGLNIPSNLDFYLLLNFGGYSEQQVMQMALGFTPFGEGQAYSEATYNSFMQVLEQNGLESLQQAQQSIQQNLDEHLDKLQQAIENGGYTSSIEKEIKTFQSQLNAIGDILKKIGGG